MLALKWHLIQLFSPKGITDFRENGEICRISHLYNLKQIMIRDSKAQLHIWDNASKVFYHSFHVMSYWIAALIM